MKCWCKICRKSVERKCQARVKSVPQERPVKVAHKSAPLQECPTRLSEKSDKQKWSARLVLDAIGHLLFAFHCSVGTILLGDVFNMHLGSWLLLGLLFLAQTQQIRFFLRLRQQGQNTGDVMCQECARWFDVVHCIHEYPSIWDVTLPTHNENAMPTTTARHPQAIDHTYSSKSIALNANATLGKYVPNVKLHMYMFAQRPPGRTRAISTDTHQWGLHHDIIDTSPRRHQTVTDIPPIRRAEATPS